MREIKFRGKSIVTDEWIYGDLIHFIVEKKHEEVNYTPGKSIKRRRFSSWLR